MIARRWIGNLGFLGALLTLTVSCTANATPTMAPSTPALASSPSPSASPSTPAPAPWPSPTPSPTSPVAASGQALTVTDNTWTDSISPAAIPLGDGNVGATPRNGYVDSCTSTFRGGGAEHAGPWIDMANDTWNENAKPAVSGAHTWSNASYHVSVNGNARTITTNDLPQKLPTGTFPIAATDPAYQYDRNPNSIVAQSVSYSLPADPVAAATPSCTPLGPIGVTTVGVLLFNALDAAGRDAGAHEIQDSCDGHPNGQDAYHYHSISTCLAPGKPNTSLLVGYALDGYGLYAEWNARGALPTNADLDACHGRTSTVLWNGKPTTMYHYDVTIEYPYTIGCFHGTPVRTRPNGA